MLTPIHSIRRGDWLYPVHPDVRPGEAAKVTDIYQDDDEGTTTLTFWIEGFHEWHGYDPQVTYLHDAWVDTYDIVAPNQERAA